MHGLLSRGQALLMVVTLVAATVSLSGCALRRAGPARATVAAASAAGKDGLALLVGAAGPGVAAGVRGFFVVGVAFVALGGLAFCFGGGRTAASVFLLGVLTAGIGVVYLEYPWTMPVLAAAVVGVATVAWWEKRRSERALAVTAAVIESSPEGRAIKDGIKRLGNEAEQTVRSVVGPIKQGLRKGGRIPGSVPGLSGTAATRPKDDASSST